MAGIIPWRSRGEMDRLRGEVDRMFEDFFTRFPFPRARAGEEWLPPVDIAETDKEVVVQAELPGMNAKDIDISINGRVLHIRGERKQERVEKDKNYHRIERKYGSFARSFELPADVDTDKVEASYKDGVLKLHLPKAKEQSVKKIEVRTS